MLSFLKKNKVALIGGLISTLFIGLGIFLLGNVSGYEAKQLLEGSVRGINMLCNTVVLASATILALLLTLLGISSGSQSKLKKAHYFQVLSIAKIDTILFIAALILFQLFNIPITESENVPVSWFTTIYWVTLLSSSVISGMLVTVILLLYSTVKNIITIVGLGQDHPLISSEEEEEVKDEK
ncbi:hypothetical protein O4H26_14670 [Aequorivita viscosa]|nr:hypothetical protein [Aequorivita viscosa]